jgi:hypothetical protein
VSLRLSKFLLATMLAASLGLHWIALQTVAWTTMLAANLSCENLSTAVSNTFDGQHPCCLCKAIAAGKKSEKKSDLNLGKTKLEYPPMARNFQLFAPVSFNLVAVDNHSAESFFSKPPLPPPRRFFA